MSVCGMQRRSLWMDMQSEPGKWTVDEETRYFFIEKIVCVICALQNFRDFLFSLKFNIILFCLESSTV